MTSLNTPSQASPRAGRMTAMTEHEKLVRRVAMAISGAPFPSAKSLSKARAAIAECGAALTLANERIARLEIELAAAKIAITHPHGEVGVGAQVEKRTGYKWPGEVRSVFTNRAGEVRFVVECTAEAVSGALHIFNGDQIRHAALKGDA